MYFITFRWLRSVLSLLVLLLAMSSLAGPTQNRQEKRSASPQPPKAKNITISYLLSMLHPVTHLFEVAMTASNISAPHMDVQFPAWAPGHYTITNSARNVQEFSAATPDGRLLPAGKTDIQTWRVETSGSPAVRISYKIYASQLTNTGIHLDDTHGFFNGALLFPYVVGAKDHPVTLIINKPPQWAAISTGLEQVAGSPYTFTAPDYDTFIDAPTEIGNQQILRFTYQNAAYEIAIYGNHNYDLQRFQSEIERLVRSQVEMMTETPFKRYVFIYQMTPTGGGGLEHLNSTVIDLRKYNGASETGWDVFRGVTSHEFFHLWNVKRIRPAVLGPFDYTQPVPTRYLYVLEGMTSYYGDLHICRAGLWTPRRYYEQQGNTIKTLQDLPGRRILSVEESSINAWLKPDDAPNVSFSYYTKGDLLGMLLDLEIRHRTDNARSLDDVFRYLNNRYALPKAGFPPGAFEKAVETVAGSSLSDFFLKYVSGTEELPYDKVLAYAGLFLRRRENKSPYLGITFSYYPVGIIVTSVSSEGPASNVLAPNDILLAIDNERATTETLPFLLKRFKEGQQVPMAIFRGDRLLNVTVPLAIRSDITYTIREDPNATPQQVALRTSWLTGKKAETSQPEAKP